MLIREMFESLPEETKKQCYETLEACKRLNECRPDEWKHIVNYYYELENEKSEDWFNYWE